MTTDLVPLAPSKATALLSSLAPLLPHFTADQLATFSENLELAMDGGLAPATIRALREDGSRFITWCQANGHQWMPASVTALAAYIREMGERGKRLPDGSWGPFKPATLDRLVFSVRKLHNLAEVPEPSLESPKVKLTRKRHARIEGRAQKQAPGLTKDKLDLITAELDRLIADRNYALEEERSGLVSGKILTSDELDEIERYRTAGLQALRDRAMLWTGYHGLTRGEELLALRWDDLSEDGIGGHTLTIRRSKTDQEGVGSDFHIWPKTLVYLREWREAHDAELERNRAAEDHRYALLVESRNRQSSDSRGRKRVNPIRQPVRLEWLDTPFLWRGLTSCAYWRRDPVTGIIMTDGRGKRIAERWLGWSSDMSLVALSQMIKDRAESAGVAKGASYSSHSLRIGAAQDILAGGADLAAAMQAGRWKSTDMLMRYCRKLLAARGAMAEMGRRYAEEAEDES
jgi:site-specific recombinase XerD